jgi:hypothetical protein
MHKLKHKYDVFYNLFPLMLHLQEYLKNVYIQFYQQSTSNFWDEFNFNTYQPCFTLELDQVSQNFRQNIHRKTLLHDTKHTSRSYENWGTITHLHFSTISPQKLEQTKMGLVRPWWQWRWYCYPLIYLRKPRHQRTPYQVGIIEFVTCFLKTPIRISVGKLILQSKLKEVQIVRGCIHKFPDCPPGTRTTNGKALYH